MKPIILTKEQAMVFKKFVGPLGCHTKENRVEKYLNRRHTWVAEYKPLREMGFDTFVLALYNDYEVEKTLEDKIVDKLMHYFEDVSIHSVSYMEKVAREIMTIIHDHNLIEGVKDNAAAPKRSDL